MISLSQKIITNVTFDLFDCLSPIYLLFSGITLCPSQSKSLKQSLQIYNGVAVNIDGNKTCAPLYQTNGRILCP